MQIIYSNHAEEQIEIRKILKVWVEESIKSPDRTEREGQNKYVARKKLNGRSIEVVYIREKYIKIVTVYCV